MASAQEEHRHRHPGEMTGAGRAITGCAYLALFVLGAVEALIGTFQYSRGPWSTVAISFALGILLTCVLGSRGMRTAAGGVLPAAGWFGATLLLGTSTSGGSVFVTNTGQGKWFLFGGAACAAAGALISFATWSRAGSARRRARP